MVRNTWLIGAVFVLHLLLLAPQVWACTAAGPNGHIGEVVNVNPSAQVIEIRDGQSGSPLTFRATPKQLYGIRRGDRVLIKFKDEGGALTAEEVQILR
jgi:hypothetical protein